MSRLRSFSLIPPLIFLLSMAVFSVAQAQSKRVLVSFLPYLTSTERIAGGRMIVETLLPPGASPHGYEPTPRDLVTVGRAHALILSGYGIDRWLERLYRASASRAKLFKIAEGLDFVRIGEAGMVDAHVWLDVSIMAQAATAIGEALASVDTNNAGFYRQNALRERERLLQLHQEIKAKLQPLRGQGLVVLHNAWRYFARAYGLEVVAVVRLQPERDASAREMAAVITLMRERNIKAIFTEPQLPDRAAQAIARETGTTIVMLDPEGSIETKDYFAMMRFNANNILKALR
jgi:ABC-type Zn uptake system ZnuABC Zn-binding protein ZnuA